ncbi:Ku protein [Nitrosococcus halophilus Nc 4]|uniref:Non-homologous end joining protein Ku n=1 Tax=Nitrosococcus halophilus (strain Nc4) TaxID=472759 RepID=D5BVZ0_NITHN|nr:Ku protein [Nitrosococcus halophilus]ADE15569.1 Ku protein [Nitrosococcus halophilus Nc 4]
MASRATWTGHLKLSLISIPVRLYCAVSSQSRIRLHLLHQDCGQRIHYRSACPKHGIVNREEVVKGYEYEQDKYVIIDEQLLEDIKLETTKVIEVVQFINASELDPIFLNIPYYLVPEGPVAEEGISVLRQGMRYSKKIAIGQVVMGGHEHTVAIAPRDKGLLLSTLHYAEEIHPAETYFQGVEDKPVDREQLVLAVQLMENRTIPFDPTQFWDRYNESLRDVIEAKIKGTQPETVQRSELSETENFMEALKESAAEVGKERFPAGIKGT